MIAVEKIEYTALKECGKILVKAFLGSVVIACSAPFSLFLPFSIVPITMQVHIALLVSFLLGRTAGPLAVAMFLYQGMLGFPVFAGGASGILHLLGLRGGYLLGYFIAACVLSSSGSLSNMKIFYKFAIANLVVYLFGVLWLLNFFDLSSALMVGVFPFILGDCFKLLLITKIASFFSVNYFSDSSCCE